MDRLKFGRRKNQKPKVLSGRDIPSLAKFINSKDCQKVVLMVRLKWTFLSDPAAHCV